jgi:hypothetical protein
VVDVAGATSVVDGAGFVEVAIDPEAVVVGELTAASDEQAATSNPQVSRAIGTWRPGAVADRDVMNRDVMDRDVAERGVADRDVKDREAMNCGGMPFTMHQRVASGLPPFGECHSSIGMRCGARR